MHIIILFHKLVDLSLIAVVNESLLLVVREGISYKTTDKIANET